MNYYIEIGVSLCDTRDIGSSSMYHCVLFYNRVTTAFVDHGEVEIFRGDFSFNHLRLNPDKYIYCFNFNYISRKMLKFYLLNYYRFA